MLCFIYIIVYLGTCTMLGVNVIHFFFVKAIEEEDCVILPNVRRLELSN